MKKCFEEFLTDLDPEERLRLESAIPFILLVVADADDKISIAEVLSFSQSLMQSWKNFGDSNVRYFLDGDKIETRANSLAKEIKKRKEEVFLQEIEKIGSIIEQMPTELSQRYKEFIKTNCIKMANASGESFWDKNKISDEEDRILRKLIKTLKLPE